MRSNGRSVLELTDTVRSKVPPAAPAREELLPLQPAKAAEESLAIHTYLDELDAIRPLPPRMTRKASFPGCGCSSVNIGWASTPSTRCSGSCRGAAPIQALPGGACGVLSLIEAAFYERPFQAAEFLETVLKVPPSHRMVTGLGRLDAGIKDLRKSGEGILTSPRSWTGRRGRRSNGASARPRPRS